MTPEQKKLIEQINEKMYIPKRDKNMDKLIKLNLRKAGVK